MTDNRETGQEIARLGKKRVYIINFSFFHLSPSFFLTLSPRSRGLPLGEYMELPF